MAGPAVSAPEARDVHAPDSSREQRASRRDAALDIFRGIAITEVLIHHVSGFAMRRIELGTLSHDLFVILNRTLHFAVPAFLFIMAVLLTRTMVGKNRTWREFYERRARQTVIPYLLWSLIYALLRGLVLPEEPASILVDPDRWRVWLLWGKAWFHLYFMVLAIQLYLVFPLLLFALGRSRIRFGLLIVLAFAGQVAFHWAHARWIRAPFPASLLFWHLVPVLCGVWVGLHLEQWPAVWARFRWVAVPLMVIGWAIYLPQGYRQIHGLPVHSQVYHYSYWAYTLGVALCLLAFCRWLSRRGGRLPGWFQMLGTYSMPIYLLHPMLLHFWGMAPLGGSTLVFILTTGFIALTILGLSLLVGRLAARTAGGRFLFGRGDARAPA